MQPITLRGNMLCELEVILQVVSRVGGKFSPSISVSLVKSYFTTAPYSLIIQPWILYGLTTDSNEQKEVYPLPFITAANTQM
jgi:hypothetical protein